jgi:serine/threonine protein kinase
MSASRTPRPGSGSRPSGGWEPPTVEAMQAVLPQYRFECILGRGGMGAVYKAVQLSLDRPVAIKVLPGELIDDADANFTERFKNEARTMAKMNHPGIVNVYDFGEAAGGLLYIVMEFVDGTDVARMILSQGRLTADYALAITAHVCDALSYAHRHGIIHRDIKPANIMINMDGAVKVADFGLAKASDPGQSGLTKTNMAMGTPDFVAPEALIAGMTVDGRADLYAIGVMLYQMLTGNIPRGMWMMPSLSLKTDPRFDAIIAKAMQSDREARYQSAGELRRDLDVILTTPQARVPEKQPAAQKPVAQEPRKNPAAQHTPPNTHPKPASTSKPPALKKSSNALTVGIAAGLALIGAAWMLWPKKDAEITKVVSSAPAIETPVRVVAPTPAPAPQPAVNKTVAPSSPAASDVVDSRVVTHDGHRYQFIAATDITLEKARELAADKGGRLASLDSTQERYFVAELIQNQLSQKEKGSAWIGGLHDKNGDAFLITKNKSALQPQAAMSSVNKGGQPVDGYCVEWEDQVASQTASATPAPSLALPPGWTDMIPLVDVQKHSVFAPWVVEDGRLRSPENPFSEKTPLGHATLMLPPPFPADSYDLRLVMSRDSFGYSVIICFCWGEENVRIRDNSDALAVISHPAIPSAARVFKVGEMHELLIEVRPQSFRINSDGRLLFEHVGKPVKKIEAQRSRVFPEGSGRRRNAGLWHL